LGAAYLWAFVIFYTPGILVFTMAFITTGVFLALLANSGKIGATEVSFSGKTKRGIIFMFIGIILLIGVISSAYLYSQKFLALNNYSQALGLFEKAGDIDKTNKKLMKAINMDKQDEYYRALSELGLISLGQIVANRDLPADNAAALFRDNLGATIAYAREATRINPADPVNWMQLGRVYGSVVALKVDKADEAALNSYQEAVKVSPLDPSPFIASARVAMQTEKTDDARGYLQSALDIKPDFADALFMLSQIEAQAGNLEEAILRTEQTAAVSLNNFGIFFQLGLLQYQNNNFNAARMAFERAVGLNNNYANARYFLGLIYDKQGLKEKAIEQFENIAKTNSDNDEVKKILSNLKNGRSALAEIAPPAPEEREVPPISEKDQTGLEKSR
jgi:tetratricopeptide (TPR) repeat protein